MIDFSSSAYFWKHLGGGGEKGATCQSYSLQEYDGLEPLYLGQVSISWVKAQESFMEMDKK